MFQRFHDLKEATHAQPRSTALMCVQKNIMPLSWHMPISREPFRYAIAIREENFTHTLLREHNSFTLNFLPIAYYEEIDRCGSVHGDTIEKLPYSGLNSKIKDDHDNSILEGSDFVYACRVIDTYRNGDHTIFFADVDSIYINHCYNGESTLFLGHGRYATIGPIYKAKR